MPTSRTKPRRVRERPATPPETTGPTIGSRVRDLRRAAGLSQETVGAQGFVSAPGWIKVENGQRSPSEKLLKSFAGLLVSEKVIRAN